MLAKRRKKRKTKKTFDFKKLFCFFIFGCLFVFLAYSCINMFLKRTEFEKELNESKSEQEELLKQRETLKFSLKESYSDAYLEKVAREDLNFKKPGEKVFVIKKEEKTLKKEDVPEKEGTFVDKIQNFLRSFNK